MGDELDALGFATTQRWAGLAELDVAQAGVLQRLECPVDFWDGTKQFGRLVDA